MYHKEILATIQLAHHFESAFSREQVYRYLRVPASPRVFQQTLSDLIADGMVSEKDGVLFARALEKKYCRKQQWSRDLFKHHQKHLSVIARLPWVKYATLTGANAFESCACKDDIDLFLITKKNRLWLSYLTLVLLSKVWRKRGLLCINYLVDEVNLHTEQQDYYTAVQIVQMIPLIRSDFSEKIIAENSWIFEYLPNARPEILDNDFYLLAHKNGIAANNNADNGLLSRLNRFVYKQYVRRLSEKYPESFGKGIVLGEGIAKLNRMDHQDIYNSIYRKIDQEIETTLSL